MDDALWGAAQYIMRDIMYRLRMMTQEDQRAAISVEPLTIEGPSDTPDCVLRPIHKQDLWIFDSLWCIPSPKQTPQEHLNRASRCNLV